MRKGAYYNEIDGYCVEWLKNLIAAGHIPPGDVDDRSIVDVRADDLRGYAQCHFFAGLGGWGYAARIAGWPDDRELWTGSCPCQPFSVAGRRRGFADERHLWPEWRRLIAECRPATIAGEQVASASAWLGLVRGDLEALVYAVGAIPVEAASAGAYHKRDRFWFVANAGHDDRAAWSAWCVVEPQTSIVQGLGCAGTVGVANSDGRASRQSVAAAVGHGSAAQPAGGGVGDASGQGLAVGSQPEVRPGDLPGEGTTVAPTGSADGRWILGADGKARRVEPGIRLLAHGVPARVAKLRALGNAIVPQVAAEVLVALLGNDAGLSVES